MNKLILAFHLLLFTLQSHSQEVGQKYVGAYYNYYHFKAEFAKHAFYYLGGFPGEKTFLGSIISQQHNLGATFNWVFSKSKKRSNFRNLGAMLGFCTQAVRTQPSYASTEESYIFPVLQGAFYVNAERRVYSKLITRNGLERELKINWILPEIGFFLQSNHWRSHNRVVKHQLATQFASGFSCYYNNYMFKAIAGLVNTDLLNDQVLHLSRISRLDYPYMITLSVSKKL